MRKKWMKGFSLLLASAMMLAACGNDSGSSGGVNSGDGEKQESSQESQAQDSQENQARDEGQEAGGTGAEYPEYLNMDSAYPIIKDEFKYDIELRIAYCQDANAAAWEDLWFSQYLADKYNLNFEGEGIAGSGLGERKNIMFSSGDLPDIMMEMWVSNSEILKYGVEEGMLLKMDEYISEELTPGIWHFLYGDYASERIDCTAPDGHIYTLPYLISRENPAAHGTFAIYKPYLEAVGMDGVPETLDEFVDFLYKVKEQDPAGLGSENMYPWGGGMSTDGIPWFLLNAFGYNANNNYGYSPAVRNGELVIPVNDMEVFQEYLKLMNQFYVDGIINPNYFTIESSEVTAQVLAGQNAVYYTNPTVIGVTADEVNEKWVCAKPLTSQWNDTPAMRPGTFCAPGNLAISADTEYPEACMRFMDIWFNNVTENGYQLVWGANEEYSYGFIEKSVYDEEAGQWVDNPDLPEDTNSYSYWVEDMLGFYPHIGALYLPECADKFMEDMGYPVAEKEIGAFAQSALDNVWPYAVDAFPHNYYVDDDLQKEMTDLGTVIEPYVKEQVARFITGERPLSETDAFAQELKDMNIDRLQEIYGQIYDDYQKLKAGN